MSVIGICFILWLTKGIHGYHYSVTGMIGVGVLVLFRVLNWETIQEHMEWGTALFIFGGGTMNLCRPIRKRRGATQAEEDEPQHRAPQQQDQDMQRLVVLFGNASLLMGVPSSMMIEKIKKSLAAVHSGLW